MPSATPTPLPPAPHTPIPATLGKATPRAASPHQREVKAFALYVLSRGTGVPDEALEALHQVQNLVQTDRERGVKVTTLEARIGIEGERRFCVSYDNPRDGGRAVERARAIVKGVTLVNLVEEPCTVSRSSNQSRRTQ